MQDIQKLIKNEILEHLEVLNSINHDEIIQVYNLINSTYKYYPKIKTDILVKGSDYSVDQIIGREYVQEIKIIKLFDTLSTSNILNSLKS